MTRTWSFAALVFCVVALAPASRAHPLAPASLRIEARDVGAEVTLTESSRHVAVFPPPHCKVEVLAVDPGSDGEHRVTRARWHCALAGPLVIAAGADDAPLVVELRGSPDDAAGAGLIAVLDRAHPVLVLGATASTDEAFGTWLALGVEHLLGGLDHLCLVLGLTLLVGLRLKLVSALTAFTLGHSLSLALGATGVVTLPSALVESAIAVTLVLLALDLVAPPRGTSWFVRAPWATGAAVGLVHGLGFAGALNDVGLPQEHLAWALFGFNLGLEIAQLGAVAVLSTVLVGLRKLRAETRVAAVAGWIIGVAGSFWLLQRAL